jgi:hypothetical protein
LLAIAGLARRARGHRLRLQKPGGFIGCRAPPKIGQTKRITEDVMRFHSIAPRTELAPQHHAANLPYCLKFPSCIRGRRCDEVPGHFRLHMLSVRAFGSNGATVAWELVEGQNLESSIERALSEPDTQ